MPAYLGLRITATPEQVAEYVSKLWPENDEVFYCNHSAHDDEHLGAKHPHAHIVVPYGTFKDQKTPGALEKEALRKRILRVLALEGNAKTAISIYTNEFSDACTYFKHAGHTFHGNEEMTKIYKASPDWVERRLHLLPGDGRCNDIEVVSKQDRALALNETNLLGIMRKHVRLNKLEDMTFSEVLEHLFKTTRWRMGPFLRTNRIPLQIYEEFTNGVQANAKKWVDRYMPYGYLNS